MVDAIELSIDEYQRIRSKQKTNSDNGSIMILFIAIRN